MRFLIDASVSGDVIQYLRDSGHDVSSIAEISPEAEDNYILAMAVAEQRILITNDKDFGELVFRNRQAHLGVLLFRLKDESAPNQVRVLSSVLRTYASYIEEQFTVVGEDRLRIHGGVTLVLPKHEEQEPG